MYKLQERYQSEVREQLMREFELKNVMQVPRLQKVVVNIGVGSETVNNSKALDAAVGDLTIITGQKPVVAKARKSIANFKLREGKAIGVKVTLRGQRMWAFLDRLMNVALPRVRDFRGVPSSRSTGAAITRSACASSWSFRKLNTTRLIRCAGWRSRL